MANRPSSRSVGRRLLLVCVVCILLTGGAVTSAASQDTKGDQPAHTLTITTPADRISYDFRVGGELHRSENVDIEDTDEVSGQHAQGTVGLNGKDTYRFDGRITTFTTNNSDDLSITLDGEDIDPTNVSDATSGFSSEEDKSGDDQTDSSPSDSTPTPTSTPTSTPTPTPTLTATATATPTVTPASSTVLSITQFGPSVQTATVDNPARFNLTVASNATTRREDTVEIRANGRIVKRETVSLAPNSSKSTTFTRQFENTGGKTITVGFGGENESVTVAVVAPTSTPSESQTAAATSTPHSTSGQAQTQAQATSESQSQSHVSATAETQSPATNAPPKTTVNSSSEGSAGIIAGLDLSELLIATGVVLLALFAVIIFAIIRST